MKNVTISDTEIQQHDLIRHSCAAEGNTKADNVFLAGEIHGNIDSSEGKTEISDTGKVVGDITTKAIVIDENAVFDGKCSMTSKEGTTEGNTGNKEAKEQK